MSDLQCFLKGILSDSDSCSEFRGETISVPLLECLDDILVHLRSIHLSREKLKEWQLITARAGLFNLDKERLEAMYVCPKHRRMLGKHWKPSKTACQHPAHKHSENKKRVSAKKAIKGRTRASPQMSREIQMIYEMLVPVGSRK